MTREKTGSPTRLNNGGRITDRQRRFCDIYLGRVRLHIDCAFRPTAAYRAAAYQVADQNASAAACHLLAKPHVQAYMANVMRRREQTARKTEEEVAAEMEAMGMARITDAIEWDEDGNVRVKMPSDLLPDQTKAGIRSVKQRKEIRYDGQGNRIETINFEVTMHDSRDEVVAAVRYG